MKAVKGRVQAQRKFAQGAYVPPSNSGTVGNNAQQPRNEITNGKDRMVIIHNNMSARNLLDVVTFQNLHSHLQPRVVLERLVPIKQKKIVKETSTQVTKPKIKMVTAKSNSTLRLRSQTTNCTTRVLRKPMLHRRKKLGKFKKNLPAKRKRTMQKTNSTSEDERPLKYFKREEKPETPRVLRDNSAIESPKNKLQVKHSESKRTYNKEIPPEKTPVIEQPQRVTRSTSSTPFADVETNRVKLPAVVTPEPKRTYDKEIPPVKTPVIEQPQRVTRSTSSTPLADVETNRVELRVLVTPATDCSSIMSPLAYESGSESHVEVREPEFYDTVGINEWINSINHRDDIEESAFKTPFAPTEKNSGKRRQSYNPEPSPSTRKSPCPSESLSTMQDVMSASTYLLEKRCNECLNCERVRRIEQISSLIKGSRSSSISNDVYEFNADDDKSISAVIPQVYLGKRNLETNKAPAPTDTGDRTLYLDILSKDSPQVIEIKSESIPNSTKRLIKARLILKSETHINQLGDFSLLDDDILDQLLKIVNAQSQLEATKKNPEETKTSTSRPPSKETEKPQPSTSSFPKNVDGPKVVPAPTIELSEAEFNDPIAFFEKITPAAAKFGLCKVVAPKTFQPKCLVNEERNFKVSNQYITRLYSRWGPAAREMAAIKAHLATQNVNFTRAPLLEGQEVNLPKLYMLVQRNGGLKQVIEKKRWGRVAEGMRLSLSTKSERTLDKLYVKYLLPYDTLSNEERKHMMAAVEKGWNHKNQKLLDWALNPLHRQKKLLDESESSEDEADEEADISDALAEAEDCVVKGRSMNLATFRKVAAKTMQSCFSSTPTPQEAIAEYWRLVLLGTEHVCVNAASIDTGDGGYGFTTSKTDPCSKHPWNLKVISQNPGNVLRSLGSVLGVTVPTLHLGMVFSTSCWHRDPHGLPWIEYMHQGPAKTWYGIPNEQSSNFRKAVEALCPTSCQNKSIWLPSDITMIPPNLLLEHNVCLSHVVQNPGEFIIVFPKAYSCAIATGYTESESVYFATNSWLKTVHQVFQEVRASCEPTTFSLEQLLIAQAKDLRTSLAVLHEVHASLTTIINEELNNRRTLCEKKLKVSVQNRARNQPKKRPPGAWNVREQDECEICRATLYLSKVTGLTGKKSSVCLQHAIRLLDTPKHKKHDVSALELAVYYPEDELENIMSSVQKRLFP